MDLLINENTGPRLERSCGPSQSDWVKIAPSHPGLDRVEAFFSGHGFDAHRHDTYAIGFTIDGVQCFDYRGESQRSGAGQVFVLHPDEKHDGRSGTSAGFRYKILYIESSLIQHSLGEPHSALPFLRQAVSNDARLASAIVPALDDLDRVLEDLHLDQIVLSLSQALAEVGSSAAQSKPTSLNWRAVDIARDYLAANVRDVVTSGHLESITGLSRYELARHFRGCLGTSPYRYLVTRRVNHARSLLQSGATLADAALSSGFADQSHMSRQFKRTYGITPGRWALASVNGRRDMALAATLP